MALAERGVSHILNFLQKKEKFLVKNGKNLAAEKLLCHSGQA